MKDARDWAFEFMTTKDVYPDLTKFACEIQRDALEAASVECDHTAMNAKTCGDDARILGWLEALRDDILNLLPASADSDRDADALMERDAQIAAAEREK